MKKFENDPPLAEECKMPWIIRSFLYPFSIAGIFHILIFAFVPTLLILLHRHVFRFTCMASLLSLGLNILLFGYGIYFVTYCVYDSSRGSRNAIYIPKMHFPDRWELVGQYFLLLASLVFCFWPVGAYYFYFKRIDIFFWLLLGCGLFFFPMAFLSVVLFDDISALNPVYLVVSMFKTFLAYCSLFLMFCALIAVMIFVLPVPSLFGFIGNAVRYYLLLVLANRLGWFYWWHKNKLGWGI